MKLPECDFQKHCLTIFIGKKTHMLGGDCMLQKGNQQSIAKKNKIGTRGRVVLQFLLGTTTIPTLKKLFSENTPISNNYKSRECISLEVTLSTLNLKNKYVHLHMYVYTQCLDC